MIGRFNKNLSFGMLGFARSGSSISFFRSQSSRVRSKPGIFDLLQQRKYAEVEEEFRRLGDAASTSDYCALMWTLVRTKRDEEMDKLLAQMQAKNVPLESMVFKCFFARLRDKGAGIDEFQKLLDRMKELNVKPQPDLMNLFLEQMRDLGRLRGDLQVTEVPTKMLKARSILSFSLLSLLLLFVVLVFNYKTKAYSNFRKSFDVIGDTKTFDLLLDTASEFSYHFVTLEVIKLMREDKIELTASQALSVMNVGLLRRYGPLVRTGYERILELGADKIINEGTWMELLQHWSNRGTFSNILAVESLLGQRFPDSQPCEGFYHLAIHAMTKKPHVSNENRHVPWVEVFTILHRMEDKGISLDSRVLDRRIMAPFSSSENVDEAFFALEDMRDDPECLSKPRLSDLNLIISGCGRLRDLDRAFATFAEIPKVHSFCVSWCFF